MTLNLLLILVLKFGRCCYFLHFNLVEILARDQKIKQTLLSKLILVTLLLASPECLTRSVIRRTNASKVWKHLARTNVGFNSDGLMFDSCKVEQKLSWVEEYGLVLAKEHKIHFLLKLIDHRNGCLKYQKSTGNQKQHPSGSEILAER